MTASFSQTRKIALAAGIMALATACSNQNSASLRSLAPIPEALRAEMAAKNMPRTSPILVRVYKKESELEVWKQTATGRFALLKTYPICRWSGQLGPKKNEGDRQVPEGFYQVNQSQLNPNSKYYLSFDVGYPNNFDKQLGRAGGNIMVHGACSSRGCFAMTDTQMAEIYAVAREALQAGQPAFQLQSYPFRMTAENMARNRRNPNIGFWQNLKEGSDNFEVTKQAVKVDACKGRYVFNGENGAACGISPVSQDVASAVMTKKRQDDQQIASLISSGTKAVNYIYEDGGANPVFTSRGVDRTAVPGKDRPFTRTEVTEVSLNENGAPATDLDAQAAKRVTYSAAENLLMSEALIARRPVKGPMDSKAVATRQQAVYARLMGSALPAAPAEKKQPQPVVASAASGVDAPVDQVVAMAPTQVSSSQPFYSQWFGGGSTDAGQSQNLQAAAATPTAVAAPASPQTTKPRVRMGKPVVASAAPPQQMAAMPAPPANGSSDRPFYKRWLGFADDTTASTGSN